MNVDGQSYRTIQEKGGDPSVIVVIDQNLLPVRFALEELRSCEEVAEAIRDMRIRGAGLLGAAAGYGMHLAALRAPEGDFDGHVKKAAATLIATRPTAKNIEWAVKRQLEAMSARDSPTDKREAALASARAIAEFDVACCRRIGRFGVSLLAEISKAKNGAPVNILTHCNAGALAFVDLGTATAPVYEAFDSGLSVHVWVDETRPRNQGASLTAWELGKRGVPYTLIVDNAGGHLMQRGLVDIVLVGCDRATKRGDAANKIGTYLKALAARDNGLPFYVALPTSSIDWELEDGIREIPIEERAGDEICFISGSSLRPGPDGFPLRETVRIGPVGARALNVGFDVTPARLITGFITERGIREASEAGLAGIRP